MDVGTDRDWLFLRHPLEARNLYGCCLRLVGCRHIDWSRNRSPVQLGQVRPRDAHRAQSHLGCLTISKCHGARGALPKTELYFGYGVEPCQCRLIRADGALHTFIRPLLLVRRGPLRLWSGLETPPLFLTVLLRRALNPPVDARTGRGR